MVDTKQYGQFFRVVRRLGRWIFPKYKVNQENYPDFNQATVLVSRHANLKGPIRILLWSQLFIRTWVLSEFIDQQAAYDQYVNYTFTKRFGMPKALARLLARPTSFFASRLVQSSRAIPVYRKSRQFIKTFRQSLASLQEGIPILIFPDVDYADENGVVEEIYEGFLTLEYFFQKKVGSQIQFVPLYADPVKREIRFWQPIIFNKKISFKSQRSQVAQEIQKALNELAKT